MESVVEIDENERYWVGGGFGARRLLPNDRGAYTTTDGSISWKTTQEASEDLILLGRGWTYTKTTNINGNENEDSNEGEFTSKNNWMYAKDFRLESIKNAKPDRRMMDFVRFRRLYRSKIFNPNEFLEPSVTDKCNQVDSSALDAYSAILMDTLTYGTLLHAPINFTDAIGLPLKERIINIAISQPTQNNDTNADAFYQFNQLRIKLEKFIEQEQAKTVMNRLLKSVDFPFDKRSGNDIFNKRRTIVGIRCLPSKECDVITTLIVKNLDPNYQLHCNVPAGDCGESCIFFRIPCTNDGCPVIMSRKYVDEHNNKCPYKIIECQHQCGDMFPRHQQDIHYAQSCKMRDVECPFKNIGCIKTIRACDLQAHVGEDQSAHLLLAVNRMTEHQDVIKNLNTRVVSLEAENKELKKSFEKQVKKSTLDKSQFDTKLKKTNTNLTNYEATCKKEFRKISSKMLVLESHTPPP